MARSWTSGAGRASGLRTWALAGVLGATATLAHAERLVVFTDDFESGKMRSNWTGAKVDQSANLTKFAGRMTTTPVDLKVAPPPENQSSRGKVTYFMRFDLITLDGWTGKTADGKDMRFEVQVGEKVMFSHSLASMAGEGTYCAATEGPRAMAFGEGADSVYRGVQLAFQLAADDDLNVQFRATGMGDEAFKTLSKALGGGDQDGHPAWGLDNVEIWCEYQHEGASSAGREAETPLVASPGAIGGGGEDPLQTQGTAIPRPPVQTYHAPEPKELMPPGGGGGGGGSTPSTPFTPPPNRPTPPEVDPREDPTPPTPEKPEHRDTPEVPAPGVLGVIGLGMPVLLGRRRSASL